MSILVLDIEGNGLRPEADKIWCAVGVDYDTGDVYTFYDIVNKDDVSLHNKGEHTLDLSELPIFLEGVDSICMHNGIEYDRWLIKKIFSYEIPLEKVIDTLILSQLLDPQRPSPDGWIGPPKPHSVEAWGIRFGRLKPEHEDWSCFSQEMLHRCREDAFIQREILETLWKEANE